MTFIKCPYCGWVGAVEELADIIEGFVSYKGCPVCGKNEQFMDFEGVDTHIGNE